MNIESRFTEKTTYFILVGCIALAFVASILLCLFLYFETLVFWEEASPCMVEQSFECLLDALTHQSFLNVRISTFITCIVSINGIVASLIFLMLFKQKG